ncbi:hypothetical protein [Photobacterium leiognathi]|uniref:hypothetical protein n=1 Tax=Photobacterium leiognathi TaxID=553611 RepID=UPI002980F0A4|nr:hypothetical protein [Photobacterium leiognathi]
MSIESADTVNLHLFKKAKKNRADDNICRLLQKEDVNAYGVIFIVSKDRVLVERIIDLLINRKCNPEVICPLWLHPTLSRFNRKNLKRIINRWDKVVLERLAGRIFTHDELTKTLNDFDVLSKFNFITLVRLMIKHDRILPFYGKEQYYIKKRCLELDFKVFNFK